MRSVIGVSVGSLVCASLVGTLALFSLSQNSTGATSCSQEAWMSSPCFECRFQAMVTGTVTFVTAWDAMGNPISTISYQIQLPMYGKCTQGPARNVCYSVQVGPNSSNETPTCTVELDQDCGGDFTRWLSPTCSGTQYTPVGVLAPAPCPRKDSRATGGYEPAADCLPIPGIIPPGGFWTF